MIDEGINYKYEDKDLVILMFNLPKKSPDFKTAVE
jgi:hypothetical protein